MDWQHLPQHAWSFLSQHGAVIWLALVTIANFVWQSVFSRRQAQTLESYKSRLNREQSQAVETLRASLNQELESHKHKLNQEMETFKLQTSAMLGRMTKLYEKEFEVLPQAWLRLVTAGGHFGATVDPFMEEMDLSTLTDDQTQEFLQLDEWNTSEQNDIMRFTGRDRQDRYHKLLVRRRVMAAKAASTDLHNYLVENKIFLSADIGEKFGAFDQLIGHGIVEYATAVESGDRVASHRPFKEDLPRAQELQREIESLVQKRLHFTHEAPTDPTGPKQATT